jgi:FtsP/CotA-like multicopper oxidase with cupredoxin domain
MPTRHIYLKIEEIVSYNPVNPEPKPTPPRQYKRDCMRNPGHDDGTIPDSEVAARAVSALIYREYLDPTYAIPKPDKIVLADINEPSYYSRVPGTVIYAHPGDRLHIHVFNGDSEPHSFHLHGLSYGIDSDGAWPLGTQAKLGPLPGDVRRSDEICPGQMWTYTYDVTPDMIGAWPFHDHYKRIGEYVNRGLFGGLVVRPSEHPHPPPCNLPMEIQEFVEEQLKLHPLPLPILDQDPQVERMRDYLMEFVEFPENRPVIHAEHPLDVPLFFHAMSGGGTPAFSSPDLAAGATFNVTFGGEATYNYHCNFHQEMHGTVVVSATAPSSDTYVLIEDEKVTPPTHPKRFNPDTATVKPGGTVHWQYAVGGMFMHTVTEDGGGAPSLCFNGRSYVGNTPTVVAHAGQKIRWYVFNLDLGMVWHNFHPHAQRWHFADATVDVRGISPAESFVLETIAPPALLLPPDIEKTQEPKHRPKDAKQYKLRGDFLVHCHIEPHMMQGLACLVRSRQTVWLTPAQADLLQKTTGLPLDSGDNACPAVKLDRCASIAGGKWEEVPGRAAVTMMHATLLAQTDKVLFWGYGDPIIPRSAFPNTTQLWDPTGGYVDPIKEPYEWRTPPPPVLPADGIFANLHSAGHAYLDDVEGTLLAHGGETAAAPPSNANNQQAFLFHPSTTQWELVKPTQGNRFYATTMTLDDGRLLTMYGNANTIEVFKPGPKTWDPEIALPVAMNYRFYPWAYLLPGGDIFIAGHQALTTRFSWTPAVVIRDQWPTINGDRSLGGGELGTSVLLQLRPPSYEPRVLIAAGRGATARTAEMIDLSAAMPAWMSLATLQRARPQQCTATLLPDGRVFLAGGTESAPGVLAPGPAEIFDPTNPAAGWKLTPPMTYARGYHSSSILLTDGSVLVGGDPPDAMQQPTPHERFFPGYCFLPRPMITNVAPASVGRGANFTINTPDAPSIAEVVLMRPGAVTHGFNQTQRLVGCTFTRGANTLSVQAPPNDAVGRNAAPPGWYMLFIVNGGRVPSIAKWIRLTP